MAPLWPTRSTPGNRFAGRRTRYLWKTPAGAVKRHLAGLDWGGLATKQPLHGEGADGLIADPSAWTNVTANDLAWVAP